MRGSMANPTPIPNRTTAGWEPVAITQPADDAAEAAWQKLCEGLTASWLDEIASLRAVGDDLEASLDIWSIALTAELKNPDHKDSDALVLTRLRKLADEQDGRSDA